MQRFHAVFKRKEQKYLLTQKQCQMLWEWIAPYLERDEYGHSTVCNIYYDTDDFELIRSSIERPAYKEKLRLRSYGVPEENTVVFLEIKKKYGGIVYKRRIGLPLAEAVAGLEQGFLVPKEGQEQITAEINYLLRRYQLKSVVFLAYDRDAFYGREDSDIRMTFDASVRSRRERLMLSDGADGVAFFDEGEVLLEIKTSGAYPLWLVHAIEACQIYPVSFSKYGNVYRKFLFPDFLKERNIRMEGIERI